MSVLEPQTGHSGERLGASTREMAAVPQVEEDSPLHICSQLAELQPHILLPVGVEQGVQEGVAQSQKPEVVLNDSVGQALKTDSLHDAGDEKWQPGQREAPDEHGDSAHGLHVAGGAGWGAAPRQPCVLHFLDMLHMHRGNFQHVTVEINEEKERWEEADAEDGEHVGRVEDPEEGALLMGGDLLKARTEDWEEADDGSDQPEPHQAHPNPQACHQLEIVERLPDRQVPVTGNHNQG